MTTLGTNFLLVKFTLYCYSLCSQSLVPWLLGMEMVSDFTPQHKPVCPFPVFERVLDVCTRFYCKGGRCEVGIM